MFPSTWINYRLAAGTSSTLWAYGTGEYHVEAYQIDLGSPAGPDEKIQLADYRILFGLRLEGTQMAAFIEGGWVFDRHVKFLHGTPGFDIASSVVGRVGMMY